MNGATGEGSRIAAPISSNVTTMMGVNHHFLLYFRKSMNSRTIPGSVCPDSCSNSSLGRLESLDVSG